MPAGIPQHPEISPTHCAQPKPQRPYQQEEGAMTRDQLSEILAKENQATSALDRLDNHELEIISLMSQGSNSSHIAQELFITRDALDTAKAGIRQKLGLKDEVALVRFAAQQSR
jgi:DNA-binding NarL/FixJ family response regulator